MLPEKRSVGGAEDGPAAEIGDEGASAVKKAKGGGGDEFSSLISPLASSSSKANGMEIDPPANGGGGGGGPPEIDEDLHSRLRMSSFLEWMDWASRASYYWFQCGGIKKESNWHGRPGICQRIQTAPHERFGREGIDMHTIVTISLGYAPPNSDRREGVIARK